MEIDSIFAQSAFSNVFIFMILFSSSLSNIRYKCRGSRGMARIFGLTSPLTKSSLWWCSRFEDLGIWCLKWDLSPFWPCYHLSKRNFTHSHGCDFPLIDFFKIGFVLWEYTWIWMMLRWYEAKFIVWIIIFREGYQECQRGR